MWDRGPNSFFCIWITSCPHAVVEDAISSSTKLSLHSSLLSPHSELFIPCRYTSLWSCQFPSYQVFYYSTWTCTSLNPIYESIIYLLYFSLANHLHLKALIKYLLPTRQNSRFSDTIPMRHQDSWGWL